MSTLLKIDHVSKAFPGVQALRDVSLEVRQGEVHAIVGENGAGKSTLMKIVAGVFQPDSGEIFWDGQPLRVANPAAAQRLGISIIFQELNLIPDLTVAENILLNHEPTRRPGILDWRTLREHASGLMGQFAGEVDVDAEIRSLSVAQQQIIEIIKALSIEARLIIMDEPTASLNQIEVERLFDIIRILKSQGKAVVFISHRLKEVFKISDVVTILKDGQLVSSSPTAELTMAGTVFRMIGRPLSDAYPSRGDADLEERDLLLIDSLVGPRLHGVSLALGSGEILGLAGLEGQGQIALAQSVFGLEPVTGGRMLVKGRETPWANPRAAIRAGIVYVSDDRRKDGLALGLSVRENVALPNLGRFTRWGIISEAKENRAVSDVVARLRIRTPSIDRLAGTLSGGNQQKTVLAKWLVAHPRIFVFVEPTRGIDVGSKMEIHHLMRSLAEDGAGILMVSSDMLELLGMSDRIAVFRGGKVVAEMPGASATEAAIMLAATGIAEATDD